MSNKEFKINRTAKSEKVSHLIAIISLVALVVIPLIVRSHQVFFYSPTISGSVLKFGNKVDFFNYFKFVWLVIETILLISLFVYKLKISKGTIPLNQLNVATFLLILTYLFSFLCSPYKNIAFIGLYDRFTGTLTFVCFALIFMILLNTPLRLKLQTLIYCFLPFIVINALLGVLNFFDRNVLKSGVFDTYLLGNTTVQTVSNNVLSTTINNVDYISGMAGVFLSVFLYLTLVEQKPLKRVGYALITFMCYTMVLTSTAMSGFLSFILALILTIILLLLSKRFTMKKLLSIVLIVLFMLVETIGFSYKNQDVWTSTFGYIIKTNPIHVLEQGKAASMDLIKSLDNRAYAKETSTFQLPTLPKEGHSALSGRTYIWKNTLRMVQKKPILGYGLDTFPYDFNQNDPNKFAHFGGYNVIVDKPHNLYLDFAYGSGVFSLILFLFIIGTLIRMFFRKFTLLCRPSRENDIAVALFIGILSFLLQGLVNDLIIGNAIIFWSVLGILGNYLGGLPVTTRIFSKNK